MARTPSLNILMVASEAAPWAKTGGLGDVLGALPDALDRLDHRVTVVLPAYRHVNLPPGDVIASPVHVGVTAYDIRLHVATLSERRRFVFVDYPPYFDRDGYYSSGGREYPDNDRRFALLAMAALQYAEQQTSDTFDAVHAHDWQAGLVPLWLRLDPGRWPRLRTAGLVCTIHNLLYRGLFPRDVVPALGLPWSAFTIETAEFWGQLSFLKAGIAAADVVTTVSPTYATETLTAEFGNGFEGILRAKGDRYLGILNGIDAREWNPASDPKLPAVYDASNLAGKRVCKRALLERFGLPMGDDALARPVIGLVSRLAHQKGIDLVAEASPALLQLDARWVFLGTGDAAHEQFFRDLSARAPSRVGVLIGFDDGLAHLIEAGADMFLMPSLFEPCGLNQMYSLRYGTVPIVHAVGGLEDTVQNYTPRSRYANGFKFRQPTAEALIRVVQAAVRLYSDRESWLQLIRQGMSEDHSWESSAREYVRVYKRARQDAATR